MPGEGGLSSNTNFQFEIFLYLVFFILDIVSLTVF